MLLCTLSLAFAGFAFASYDKPILGISLGKRDLTIVESLADGSTSLIARVAANVTYTNWFEQTLKISEHEKDTIDPAALHKVLLAAQHAVTKKLQQQQSQFSIVTTLEEIRDPIVEALLTLNLLAPVEVPATSYIRPARAVHYAYALGTCEAADLPKGCNPKDIDAEALWLDFDADSLIVRLLGFEEHAANPGAEIVISGLTRMDRPEKTGESMAYALQKHFSHFLDQNTVLKDFPDRRGHKYKPLRSDIKVVVASGNPPPDSLEAVRLAIHRISPDLAKRVRESADTSLVMATGAALRARQMQDHPELYSAYICPPFEDHAHDEL